jgi:hypothetical protein
MLSCGLLSCVANCEMELILIPGTDKTEAVIRHFLYSLNHFIIASNRNVDQQQMKFHGSSALKITNKALMPDYFRKRF